MKILKENIKLYNFMKCYLFCGSEEYLKNYYVQKLKNAVVGTAEAINLDIFDGKDISIDSIIASANTPPFMSEKRLILIKNSQLFQNTRKNDTEKMKEYLIDMPESTCIVFIESDIDKRNKLYKAVQNIGHIVEFIAPKENELIVWLQNKFKINNKTIDTKMALYMLRSVGTNMELLINETKKLVSYKDDDSIITKNDIDLVCVKSLEAKIFDMLDAIGNKNVDKALEIYNNMIILKEEPIKILIMIIRQFRLLIQTKYLLSEGYNAITISERIGQRTFVVKELVNQCKNFSQLLLMNAFEDCLETDISIKTGTLAPETGVELLIVKYSL